jgi:NAD-dependent dihydropyrimidine dehydrogenase PreA subunit
MVAMALELFPRIEIDRERCTTPFACKRCIRACPTAVFQVLVVKMVRLQETDKHEPGSFRLAAPYRDKCTGCNICIDVCPEDALKVYLPEIES